MRSMRYFTLTSVLLFIILAPSLLAAQFTVGSQYQSSVFSKDEAFEMLIQAGASEPTAMRVLERFPDDYQFKEEEVRDLLTSIPAEELLEEFKSRRVAPDEAELGLQPGAPRGAPMGVKSYAEKAEEGEILRFGHNIFALSPLVYEPTEDVAVGPDYVIGRGDEVYITLWGAVEKNYKVLVNREGNIVLPELGVVHAAGSTLEAFERMLNGRFSGVYSDFNMDISLGKLRTIQVVVVGDVVRPGAYSVSPVSTVFNALYYAGGPSAVGSLRDILVYRSGELFARVDLYDYLLTGDNSQDVRLRSGDTIFVTALGPTVTVMGMVRRPAVYELKGEETVMEALDLAGGFTAESFSERVEVMRVFPDSGLTSLVVDLSSEAEDDSTEGGGNVRVMDGDEITVYPVWHVNPKEYVSVEGMVQFPDTYLLYPGMRVSDLIFKAGGLLDQAYMLHAEISRIVEEPEKLGLVSDLIFIRLQDVVEDPDSEQDVTLERGDKVYVRKVPGWKLQDQVKIEGEVRFPGTYALETKEEKLSELLERAGGLTLEAFPRAGSVFREDGGRVVVDIAKALEKPKGMDNITLVDGDSIYIPIYTNTISVIGAVGRPGSIVFTPGKGANYYVEKTGGFLEDANKGSVRIVRLDGSTEKARKRLWFDPEVQPGNKIIVDQKKPGPGVDWRGGIRDVTAILASMATTIYIVSQID